MSYGGGFDVPSRSSVPIFGKILGASTRDVIDLGKPMPTKRLPTIFPTLSASEKIKATRIYSALGRLRIGKALLAQRPFRSTHQTISDTGLVGGGSPPSPGKVSLANRGVLFLDELPEFNRKTLAVTRQPLKASAYRTGTQTFNKSILIVFTCSPGM